MRVFGSAIPGAFSGIDKAVFSRLERLGVLGHVAQGSLSETQKLRFLLRAFHPRRSVWARRWYDSQIKHPDAFIFRTKTADRFLRPRQSKFDVVLHMQGLHAPFWGKAPKPFCLLCDYTTVLAARNYQPWFELDGQFAQTWYELETELYMSAAHIFSASDNTRRSLVDDYGIAEENITITGLGVDRVYPDARDTGTDPTILFVGIDFERKGGPQLLSAFERVRREIPHARLKIVGPPAGPPQPGVEWLGFLEDRASLHRAFSESSIFSLPTLCETFGLVVVEAMAHGLPVVASTVDAMAEIVEPGKTGFLVSPRSEHDLSERLLQLLTDAKLRSAFGTAARRRVADRFLWDHVVTKIHSRLKVVVNGASIA